tara:strand:- start:566 stop:712 length:147 start_codon:yes stop_codon:yes gene_type:complete
MLKTNKSKKVIILAAYMMIKYQAMVLGLILFQLLKEMMLQNEFFLLLP